MEDVAFLDATAQAELVHKGEVKPIELVEDAITRVERLNPTINAVITKTYDLAREIAASQLPMGPFTGVPLLLKDIYGFHTGVRQTHGSKSFGDYVPDFDSELVVRHRRAGFIPIGKTNAPEFGISITTEPERYGPTRNPWNTGHSAGGSSGGSGAAVASGMVPIAHANDGGGSTRIPASCCGVFGLKATRSRNPLRPQFSDLMLPVVSEHAITRSVRDSAAMLDATAGASVGDPYHAPLPARPYVEEVGAHPGTLKIAFTTDNFNGAPVHADCAAAIEDAANLCAELGHEVTEAAPMVDGASIKEALNTLWCVMGALSVEGVEEITGRVAGQQEVEPFTWSAYEVGREVTATAYVGLMRTFQQMLYEYGHFFADYDVLLTPTLASPPVELGASKATPGEDPRDYFDRVWWTHNPYAPIANVTGQPAMSVPSFWNDAGLPIGTHYMARFGDEATLFRLAAQLEEARPWANKYPPISSIGS